MQQEKKPMNKARHRKKVETEKAAGYKYVLYSKRNRRKHDYNGQEMED